MEQTYLLIILKEETKDFFGGNIKLLEGNKNLMMNIVAIKMIYPKCIAKKII